MRKHVLLGLGRYAIPLPSVVWKRGISKSAQKAIRVASMSEEYHLVRDFVVRAIPRVGEPLSPEFIGQELDFKVIVFWSFIDLLYLFDVILIMIGMII